MLMFIALTFIEKVVASPNDIDRVWMLIMRTSPGPFSLMDMIGLDVLRDSGQHITVSGPIRRSNDASISL